MSFATNRFPSIPVKNWLDLVTAELKFSATSSRQDWVFRGQPFPTHSLLTTLDRACDDLGIERKNIPCIEWKLIVDFRRSFHRYTTQAPPDKTDTLEWLSLMQHYGAPTRLLDFTFSFYIAAFFALEHAQEDSVIWAINRTGLYDNVRKLVEEGIPNGPQVWRDFQVTRRGDLFEKIFMPQDGSSLRFVHSVNAERLNERLTVQQGLFLCPGDVVLTFAENLCAVNSWEENVFKVILEKESRREILRKLHRTGINRSLLFPGIDGFAQSLRTKMLILDELREMEKPGGSRRTPNIDVRS
jgi:hypothetical protein